ncbi:MAG TPA: ester cyclase [Chloroflexota bacterium]|nr:ester cyclase [Chloroflexota bacterium]
MTITLFFANGDKATIESGVSVRREPSAAPGSSEVGATELVCLDRDGNELGRFQYDRLTGYSTSDVMMANKLLIRRLIEEVVNGKRLSELMELFAPNFIDHVPSPGRKEGIEAVRESYEAMHMAFPGAHFSIDALMAEGDRVAVLTSCETRHDGPLFGIPPTGHLVKIASIDIYRVVDGRIAEHWGYGNDFGVAQQIGLVPRLLPEERMEIPELISGDGRAGPR